MHHRKPGSTSAVQGPTGSDFAPSAADPRQLLRDIDEAENVLVRHVERTKLPPGCIAASRQPARDLISLLRKRAQLIQQPYSPPKHAAEQAKLDADVQQCKSALLSVFSDNVLSEICAVLHSLYIRTARLHSLSSPPFEIDNDDQAPAYHDTADRSISAAVQVDKNVRDTEQTDTANCKYLLTGHCNPLQPGAFPPALQQHAGSNQLTTAPLAAVQQDDQLSQLR